MLLNCFTFTFYFFLQFFYTSINVTKTEDMYVNRKIKMCITVFTQM